MKKLLALVLALVMTLSLAVVGSNAAFKDADKVNETYAEAVDVLKTNALYSQSLKTNADCASASE